MIEIFNKDEILNIKSSADKNIFIDWKNKSIKIWDFDINFPWEYEKSWILIEVKEYQDKLFYSFVVDSKVVFVLFYDDFELKEEIVSFFGDIDILLINSLKNSNKIIENIEARVVIPFWEWKETLLHTLGQHKEEIKNFKFRADLWDQNTEFINLV